MVVNVIGRSEDLITHSIVQSDAVGDPPGIFGERPHLPDAHAESALKHVAGHPVGGAESKIGQRSLRSGGADLPRILAVEIVLPARREGGKAVEAVAHKAAAEFKSVLAADLGNDVLEVERGGLALLRKSGVIADDLEAGDGQRRQSTRLVVDVDTGDPYGRGGIESVTERQNMLVPTHHAEAGFVDQTGAGHLD